MLHVPLSPVRSNGLPDDDDVIQRRASNEEDVAGGRRGRSRSGGSGDEPGGADQAGDRASAESTTTKKADTAATHTHTAKGVVKSMDATSLVVTEKGKDVSYVLDPSTKKEGDPAVGSTVTVMYKTEGTQHVATDVKAAAAKAGPCVVEAGQEVADLQRWRSTPGVRHFRRVVSCVWRNRVPPGTRFALYGPAAAASGAVDPAQKHSRIQRSCESWIVDFSMMQKCRALHTGLRRRRARGPPRRRPVAFSQSRR